jgi:hypothetical protein
MAEHPLPSFLIVGPQKCATTWLYNCLYEHPDVLMPETDSVHYFDMFYHKHESWYRNHFSRYDGEQVVGEETPTYIRDEKAPERIGETLPDVKLIFTFRNPIDRAYSHWWHEKSKDKHSFEFEEVLENYDLFQNWIVPGFYHRHLSRYMDYVPEENIKICLFDDLVENDLAYVQDVYDFLGVDDEYVPSLIDQKVNQGKFRMVNRQMIYANVASGFKRIAPAQAVNFLRPAHRRVLQFLISQTEYEKGMSDEVRIDLEEIFMSDIDRLSEYLNRDLGHWLEHIEP